MPKRLLVLLLIFFGLYCYSQTIHYPFVHDDVFLIINNPDINNFSNIFSVFLRPSNQYNQNITPYYRPLLEILYRIQYALFGFNPAGYRFTNIFLHIFNGILVFYIFTYILKYQNKTVLIFPPTYSYFLSWSVSLIFILHPLQTESVVCVSGISNILCSFFILLSFYAYLKFAVINKKKNNLLYIALLCYVLGLLAKEQAIILPLLIMLYELCFIKGLSLYKNKSRRKGFSSLDMYLTNNESYYGKKLLLVKKIYFISVCLIVTIAYLFIRKFITGKSLVPVLAYKKELWLRILVIPKTILMYWRTILIPNDLHYYRSVNILDFQGIHVLIFLVIILTVFVFINKSSKLNKRMLMFGVGWFFISILPVINIFPLIHEYSYIAAFEHFLYLPIIGFAFFAFQIVDFFVFKLFKKHSKRLFSLLLTAIVFVCVYLSINQSQYWKNEVVLFERAVKYEDKIGRLHILLGKAYYHNEEYLKALNEYQIALNIMKYYINKVDSEDAKKIYKDYVKEIYFDIAHCYTMRQDLPKVITYYQLALEVDPEDSDVHNNLGMCYIQLNDLEKAGYHFNKAIVFNDRNYRAMTNLAIYYIAKGDKSRAEILLRQALEINSNFIVAKKNLKALLGDP